MRICIIYHYNAFLRILHYLYNFRKNYSLLVHLFAPCCYLSFTAKFNEAVLINVHIFKTAIT